MKKITFLLLSLICGFAYFGQTHKTIGVEFGAVINTPFVKQEHFSSNPDMTGSYDRTYNYHISTGAYAKAAFELSLKSNTKWHLTLPLSLTYMNRVTSYTSKGWFYGCFSSDEFNDHTTIIHQNVMASAGIGVLFQGSKWRFSSNASVNNCITVSSVTKIDPVNNGDTKYNYERPAMRAYLSSQMYALFQVKKNIWVGPTCEVYFYHLRQAIYDIKLKMQQGEPWPREFASFELEGNNVWINPGIKLQIDL